MKNANETTRKTTAKEYKNSYELLRAAKNEAHALQIAEEWTKRANLLSEIEKFEKCYFDRLPMVSVKFSIGSRNYYREVVKLGKRYFMNGRSMTKGNGYWFVEEINEITEEMSAEILADSYYY